MATIARSPRLPLVVLRETLTEKTGPVFRHNVIHENDNDLTNQHGSEALGERIFVHGRVLDEEGRPVRGALIEVWQANAAGRYRHKVDGYDAPLDRTSQVVVGYLRTMKAATFSRRSNLAHIHGEITTTRGARLIFTSRYLVRESCLVW